MSNKIHKKVTLSEGVLNWTMKTSRKVAHGVPFVKKARWTDNSSSYRPI
ncbi:MAG: hypothetical protein SVC26_06585 [Pseudomonadota bacterium]|nr:hypothetical protein [Pseudomonadota bacterium]